jgi:hypothetical protein
MRNGLNLRRQDSGKFTIPALQADSGKPCYQLALEQVLVRLYGEQNLYRAGLTIQVSLEKHLQEEIMALEERPNSNPASGQVLVVTRDGEIRAIGCYLEKEEAVREKLPSSGFFFGTDYEVKSIALDSITRAQIFLSPGLDKETVQVSEQKPGLPVPLDDLLHSSQVTSELYVRPE